LKQYFWVQKLFSVKKLFSREFLGIFFLLLEIAWNKLWIEKKWPDFFLKMAAWRPSWISDCIKNNRGLHLLKNFWCTQKNLRRSVEAFKTYRSETKPDHPETKQQELEKVRKISKSSKKKIWVGNFSGFFFCCLKLPETNYELKKSDFFFFQNGCLAAILEIEPLGRFKRIHLHTRPKGPS